MKSVLEALRDWAIQLPNKKVWTFLNDKGSLSDEYTYKELENATNALANNLLVNFKLVKGDRVLLVFFPGLDFTVSLLACFKAGLIAVPVFPPDPRRLKKDLDHFVNIQLSSDAQVVLTNSQYSFVKKIEGLKSLFSTEARKWPDLQWIQVDDILKKGRTISSSTSHKVEMSDIAFLQYTSGSTSDPKGVMISHSNLAHNLSLIIKELAADESTINVSWLPQYHDMGLIGSYLGIVYCGGTGFYLSPISFLKDPLVWVTAMSTYKGTHTQAPNFAFALVARKFRESRSDPGPLDLSAMRHMINAAEPVDCEAMLDFYSIFGAYGLRKGVIFPTYGLAEHTVFVCSGGSQILTVTKSSLEAGDFIRITSEDTISSLLSAVASEQAAESESDLRIVGCGFPGKGEGVEVLIVHVVSNKVVGSDSIGEVWVQSPSKACGYWHQPELTAHDFHAHFSPDFSEEKKEVPDASANTAVTPTGYLRTGDLGFLHNGELFICGRLKDLIIVRGSNHYPQDIERTAEHCHPSLRAGCSAAFALHPTGGHTESVIYVAEVKDGVAPSQFPDIVAACRQRVAAEHGVGLHCICLLKTRTVPKTTSGKIARSWCRKAFQEGSLSVLHRWEGDARSAAVDAEATFNVETDGALDSEEPVKPLQGNKYVAVASSETEEKTKHPVSTSGHHTIEQVRQMSHKELVGQLEFLLCQISAQSSSQLLTPIDPHAPLVSLGLDSMTLVQFKGVLENRFFCVDIPDEYLFTPLATLDELAAVVHIGTLTSEQRRKFDAGAAAGGSEANSTTVMVQKKQPCCPWFTCCY